MFSWSFKWLWAQCLLASAGLFLLGHMAFPAAKDLATVSGKVEHVGVIYVKGVGSFYELSVRVPDGGQDRVLIDRRAAPEATAQALSGQEISADVNWSSRAVRFKSAGDTGSRFAAVPALAAQSSRNFILGGAVALCIGVFLGLAGLVLRMR